VKNLIDNTLSKMAALGLTREAVVVAA